MVVLSLPTSPAPPSPLPLFVVVFLCVGIHLYEPVKTEFLLSPVLIFCLIMAVFHMDLNTEFPFYSVCLLQLLGKKHPWQQFPLVLNRQGMSVIKLHSAKFTVISGYKFLFF